MKTFKYLAISALCALSLASCVKETIDWPAGVDQKGAQVYIDNTTTDFYVYTAEEKASNSAKLVPYSKGHKTVASPSAFVDDDRVSIPVVRKDTLGEYTASVNLILGASAKGLFSADSVSYLADGVLTLAKALVETGDTLKVSFDFPDNVGLVNVLVKFDITKISANVAYAVKAELGEDVEKSNFGATAVDFTITHSAPIHDPWVAVGVVSFMDNDNWAYYEGPAENITIAIHEHDFTDDSFITVNGEKVINPDKTKRTLKDQPYYRFCIPYYMYQMTVASIEAGDGFMAEGDEEYFEESNGIMFNLAKGSYDFAYDISNKVYAKPLADDVKTGGTNVLFPLLAYDHTTGSISNNAIYDGYWWTPSGYYLYINPVYVSYWTLERSANAFTIVPLYGKAGSTSLWYASGVSFTWLSNDLESDWENYFKVDYQKDVEYSAFASGSLVSEFKNDTLAVDVYKGTDPLYGMTVYYIDEPYGVAGTAIPVLVSADGKASVAASQALGESALGKPIFISQSDVYPTSVSLDENGKLLSIVAGIKVHYEGSDVAIVDAREVFTPAGAAASVDSVCINYSMFGVEIYGYVYPDTTGKASKPQYPKMSPLESTVTISKIEGNKVKIEGLIDESYAAYFKCDPGYLVGEFDVNTGSIIIPEQYYMYNGDAATCTDGESSYFMKFIPGEMDYSSYKDKDGYYNYYALMGTAASSCALVPAESGKLVLAGSPTCPVAADGYAIELYSYNSKSNEFDDKGSLYATFPYWGYYPLTLTPIVEDAEPQAAPALNRDFKIDLKQFVPGKESKCRKFIK